MRATPAAVAGFGGLHVAERASSSIGMSEPRTYQLSVSRLRLNIVEWGDPSAPPLILQHGGRDNARSWDWVARAFAGSHRVIAPDMRGHGDSEWANDGAYDMLDFVEDLAGIVRLLDLPPCAIVGHSLGGNVATRYTGLYPDRVVRLVNIEGLGDSPELQKKKALEDPLERLRTWIGWRAAFAERTPRDYPDRAALVARMREKDSRLAPDTIEHLADHAARRNADGSLRLKHEPIIGGGSPVDIAPEVKIAMWEAITCPVLLVYGAESWASNPAIDGRAAHFRNARVEVFERAGHWVHHDRRDDFIAMVRAFLG